MFHFKTQESKFVLEQKAWQWDTTDIKNFSSHIIDVFFFGGGKGEGEEETELRNF